jgi:hypothetical protein
MVVSFGICNILPLMINVQHSGLGYIEYGVFRVIAIVK